MLSMPVRVQVDPYLLKQTSTAIQFVMQSQNDPHETIVEDARFLGPAEGR